jgi:hypothetical protein
MCTARPQAKSQAKPGQNRPGQAKPKSWLAHGFGPAWGLSKPKPSRQATALTWMYIYNFTYFEFGILENLSTFGLNITTVTTLKLPSSTSFLFQTY